MVGEPQHDGAVEKRLHELPTPQGSFDNPMQSSRFPAYCQAVSLKVCQLRIVARHGLSTGGGIVTPASRVYPRVRTTNLVSHATGKSSFQQKTVDMRTLLRTPCKTVTKAPAGLGIALSADARKLRIPKAQISARGSMSSNTPCPRH